MSAVIENPASELEAFVQMDVLKNLIMETILDSTDQLSSCVVSFAYVAIQKFIAHCKDHSIDPLSMSYEDIKEFVDNNLKKELSQELKTPTGMLLPIG